MSDIRKYRGYIVPSSKPNTKWAVKFLDFPTLEIYSSSAVLETMVSGACVCGKLVEDCFISVMTEIINRIQTGLAVPVPQGELGYKPFVDVQVDIDSIHQTMCFKRAN